MWIQFYILSIVFSFPYLKASFESIYESNSSHEISHHHQHLRFSFLGMEFSHHEWKTIKKRIFCLTTKGSWQNTNAYVERKYFACADIGKYHRGGCDKAPDLIGTNYEWIADKELCQLNQERFSTKQMCSWINGRNIFVVGDSMSEMFTLSFGDAFQIDLKNVSCPANPYHMVQYGIPMIIPCPNVKFNLYFKRNDILSLVSPTNYDKTKYGYGESRYDRYECNVKEKCFNYLNKVVNSDYEFEYVDLLGSKNISLLILNRGAHFSDTTIVLRQLNETLTYLVNRYPQMSIIYRNTPHGHDKIDEFRNSTPLIKPEPTAYIHSFEAFYDQNVAVYHFLSKNFPQVLHLDFYTSTILRKDSHLDNLHYCLPGPTDSWIRTILYNTFKIIFDAYNTKKHAVN